MPIKPEKRHLYPDNWDQISMKVRQDAGQRCENCGVCNHSTGYRYGKTKEFCPLSRADQPVALKTLKNILGQGSKLFKIVLTVHHRDGDPTNNDRENLIALCQKCHLAADRELRNQNN